MIKKIDDQLKNWIKNSNSIFFSIYAMITSFSVYSCMYAFRKPFAVATFEGISFFGIDYKILLITSQVLGYTLSKFMGIKIISEVKPDERIKYFFILFTVASVSLLLFPIAPPPWNIFFLFTNGLPLGLIWGLVFSFLEGRRNTELLAAGLSVSFIFSSGLVKSVGSFFINNLHVSQYWMPFLSGLIFVPFLILSVWLLSRIPPPTEFDETLRTKRQPMNKKSRIDFFRKYSFGLIILIFIYVFLTVLRDIRDNFAVEIWNALGYKNSYEIFVLSEVPVSLILLILMASLIVIKNNYHAFILSHLIIFTGIAIFGLATILFNYNLINGVIWMILIGIGLYMGYVPFNTILFERLIATFKNIGNVGFLIYLSDSFGYLGSVAVMFVKNFFNPRITWFEFIVLLFFLFSFVGSALIIISIIYFSSKYKNININVS